MVVGIVIDQMRWDYLERYKDRYCEGGFRRMMDEGYNCTRCMINYIPAVTAVGHTSVYTGSVPALHGIVNNSFHVNGKSTSAPYDASMQTVGSTTDAGKRSPHLMMATTMGDELRMTQVLYNLINNAINYIGDDKTVIVRQTVTGEKVRVDVIDHGDGIPEEQLKYIWDRYYRVDKEHRRAVIGTGLGLSIVKNILIAHDAEFAVTSTLGEGSDFYFFLPIIPTDDEE